MNEDNKTFETKSQHEGEGTLNYVLPPKKYKLKTILLFTDFFAIFLYIYYLMIRSIIKDVRDGSFSFVSNRMFSLYCVFAITVALLVFALIFKMTKSVKTRYERDNEVRQNPNIKVWLCGFNWGWPILFVPTMVLMIAAGVVGILLNLIFRSSIKKLKNFAIRFFGFCAE